MTQVLNQYAKGISFKAEWSREDFTRMNSAILRHFKRKGARTLHGYKLIPGFNQLNECFGLAYTSTSVCAMYDICNTSVYLDLQRKYTYNHFVIDGNDFCYAICQDKDENEIIIEL